MRKTHHIGLTHIGIKNPHILCWEIVLKIGILTLRKWSSPELLQITHLLGEYSFLVLALYTCIILLDSHFYILPHSHFYHYQCVFSLFCYGGLAFMPSTIHLAWSNQVSGLQKHIAMTEQRSLPLHFLTAFLTPSAFWTLKILPRKIRWILLLKKKKSKKNCLAFNQNQWKCVCVYVEMHEHMHISITYYRYSHTIKI